MSCSCGCDEDGVHLGADDDPKPPDGYADCDKAANPEQCRKMFEAIWCLRNPGDPWCKRQRQKRERASTWKLVVVVGVVGLAAGWWTGRKGAGTTVVINNRGSRERS